MNASYSTPQVAEITGATTRQIDYWCRRGLIGEHLRCPGSGRYRQFTGRDVDRVADIVAAIRPHDLDRQITERDDTRRALVDLYLWALDAQSPTVEHHDAGDVLLERVGKIVGME